MSNGGYQSNIGWIPQKFGSSSTSSNTTTPNINQVNNASDEKLTADGETWTYKNSTGLVEATPLNIETVNNLSTTPLNTTGQIWAYNNSTGKPEPTSIVRINPNFPDISFSDGKYRVYQTNGSSVSVMNMNNTGDVQLQLMADSNNIGEGNTSSVLFGGDGTATAGYIGFVNNTLSIVSKSTSAPAISLYVDTVDFIENNTVKKPSTVSPPTPAIFINSTNVPQFSNGLLMPNTSPGTDATLNVYKRESFTATVRSQPSTVPVGTTANFDYTQIGDMIQLGINIQIPVGDIVGSDDIFRVNLPGYCRPACGSSPLPPYFSQSVIIERGAGNTDDLQGIAKVRNDGGVGTLDFYILGRPSFQTLSHSIICTISYKALTF